MCDYLPIKLMGDFQLNSAGTGQNPNNIIWQRVFRNTKNIFRVCSMFEKSRTPAGDKIIPL